MSLATPRRFRLRLIERETGILLNQAGKRHVKGQPSFEPAFSSEVEALAMKDDILALFPWAEVVMTDSESSEVATFHPSEDGFAFYADLKARFYRYQAAFPLRRWFMRRPLDPWDPTSYFVSP